MTLFPPARRPRRAAASAERGAADLSRGDLRDVRDGLATYIRRNLLRSWDGETEELPHRPAGPRYRYLVGILGRNRQVGQRVTGWTVPVRQEPRSLTTRLWSATAGALQTWGVTDLGCYARSAR
ncbi:hypothetical protein GCM10023083_52170 [Streptomyces phyllanthi]